MVVTILKPLPGACTDFGASKKHLLLFFSGLAWVFTTLPFFVQNGDVLGRYLYSCSCRKGNSAVLRNNNDFSNQRDRPLCFAQGPVSFHYKTSLSGSSR